ncbi:MAG: O-antigen ligase family protein [Acidobacteria bacterium]|nr:O-antigen ligase family protein [Acidobacteriota bacterium]
MEEAVRNGKILDRDPRTAGDAKPTEERTGGHRLTFLFVAAFAYAVYFRPHEFYPTTPVVNSLPMLTAAGALVSFLLTELMSGGSSRKFPTEVKCVLVMTAFALLTMPIARDPALAWKTFNDLWLPLVLVFFVTANVLTSLRRIKTLMLLGVAIGVYLSYQTYDLYSQGIFEIEGYRIAVDFGGMFGNPNDMAIHLVMFVPIAIGLAFAGRSIMLRVLLLASAVLMLVAVTLTQSRGGLIGIAAIGIALLSRLGKGRMPQALGLAAIIFIVLVAFAPGNIGTRIASIFDSALDPTGSHNQRQEAVTRSIYVTLRNPQGVGIGNSIMFGPRNLQTHNAYTQVSSELGWIAFGAYLVLICYPLRELSRIEKKLRARDERHAAYYLVVGTWAGIIGYAVSSFFASIAYLWFVYFPICYAIGLRELHERQRTESEGQKDQEAGTLPKSELIRA